MTTYRLDGLRVTWTDTDGDGEDDTADFAVTQLVHVAPTGQGWLSWTLQSRQDGVMDTGGYSTKVGGGAVPGSWEQIGQRVSWGAGKTTDVWVTGDDGDSHVFVVAGDAVPEFSSTKDLRQFQKSAIDVALPSVQIDMADLPGVRISENDRIAGTNRDNRFNGRVGKDKLFGKGGDDILKGGKGKDLLDGGNGDDTVIGGRGNDNLVGGKGEDRFVFGSGDGKDLVRDFQDDLDTLQLNDALWMDSHGDLSRKQVLKTFGSKDGDAYVLDFGGGDMVTIDVDISRAALINDLAIV